MSTFSERMLPSGDAQLCAQVVGDPADDAVLLICGAATSLDYWDDEFCRRLASSNRRVVRYDLRDAGKSSNYPAGQPNYSGADLVADAVAVLDGLGIERAYVAGVSMGGGIAQVLGLRYPDRVAGLALMSTTPTVDGPADRPALPSMSAELQASFASEGPATDWSDRATAIAAMVEGERLFSGPHMFDVEQMQRIAERCYDRTTDIEALQTNHFLVKQDDTADLRLASLRTPTVVMLGTDDPLFPYPHTEQLTAEIDGARLVPLPGSGHQYPPQPLWDTVIDEIIALADR